MYSSPLRCHYESILTSILGQDANFKSSKLLQAYVTLSAMLSSEQEPLDAYSSICKKYTEYKSAILHITNQQCKNLCYAEIAKYVDLPFQDFLEYVTPDVVYAPSTLMAYYHDYSSNLQLDQIQLLHHIFAVKLNTYQKITLKQLSESTEDVNDDPLTLIYSHYKAKEHNPIPIDVFKIFYSAINLHQLDPSELSPRLIGSSNKQLGQIILY